MPPDKAKKPPIDSCTKVPIAKISTPETGLFFVWVNAWWVVVDDCVLFFRGRSPQCNCDERLARKIAEKLYPGADVRQIPLAFAPEQYQ